MNSDGTLQRTFIPDTGSPYDSDATRDGDSASPLDDYRRMQDIVFMALRDQIFSGRLKPGERLNTTRLSEQLGVSRMPVREALTRLISVGLADNIPHRGAFVKKLSLEEVIEIYCIRAALEGVAARLAARSVAAADVEQLQKLCDEMERRLASGDESWFSEINQEFHGIIYHAAHAEHLEALIVQYYQRSSQYRALGLDLPGRHEEILAEHRAIARALGERDPDRAEAAAREHHLNTVRRIAQSAGSSIEI